MQSILGNSFLVMTVMVFVTVLLALEAAYLLWKSYKGPAAKRIEERISALAASRDTSKQARILKQRLLSEVPAIEKLLLDLPRAHRLQRFIHQAGLGWTVSRLVLSCAAAGAGSFMLLLSLVHQSLLWNALIAMIVATLPVLYVERKRHRRLRRIEHQLPDALDLLIRALRSGHAFSSGLQMLGEEMAEPIAGEFRIVADEVNFGVSMQQALVNLSQRVPMTDLRFFVISVLIQRESGGNLTEVLGNLSRLIRDRLKLLAKVKVLSSEGRLSAWILGVMPFAMAGLLYLFNPEFMSPLWTDPIGISIIQTLLVMMFLGILLLVKIVRIRV
ncbi:type II secretion system F family protein [Noviherbaspirillum galbum]|uniref:Type II secretion system F family protein n=1 Tax=Noviherbaspirillum galbum TaxID=2709383 RepID=A0A6B3STT8_9BURK|nr:type II secretion system F family protein [Noviherbaspirillum galbum]NEX61049.1 type II secretion system F family protein [Noviherbaspirillum galbum]